MPGDTYESLADVYEFLVPDSMLTPEGSAAAYGDVVAELDRSARVLDCAAGTGELAVGLRSRGFEVTATDASAAMVQRTRQLAAAHRVELPATVCRWEELLDQGWSHRFDVVWCVGNSLMHAPGRHGQRVALENMAGVLAPGGVLIVTSRNWELIRAEGWGLRLGPRLAERGQRRALVAYAWPIAFDWDEPHHLDIGVAVLQEVGDVENHVSRLRFWPFRHADLESDLRAAGLRDITSTYGDGVEQYLVAARR